MALIERTVLGTGEASRPLPAPVTWYLDGAELARADPIAYIDITLPANTVLGSVQGSIVSVTTPEVPDFTFSSISPNVPKTNGRPEIFPGIKFLHVTDWFNQLWTFYGINEAFTFEGPEEVNRKLTAGGIGSTAATIQRIGKSPYLYRFTTDNSIHFIVTVMRPFFRTIVPTFLNHVVIWYPYTLSYKVTGYVLNDHNQTVPEEQVSVVVQDSICNELYGFRPGKEEQSDFIETQKQALRVGEYMLWQAQMVISTEFSVPFNPAIRRGQTIRVRNTDKNIDILGIVKDVSHGIRTGLNATGNNLAAVTRIQLRSAEYIFRSTLGEADPQEILDQRQSV